jgi:hypothetical protein
MVNVKHFLKSFLETNQITWERRVKFSLYILPKIPEVRLITLFQQSLKLPSMLGVSRIFQGRKRSDYLGLEINDLNWKILWHIRLYHLAHSPFSCYFILINNIPILNLLFLFVCFSQPLHANFRTFLNDCHELYHFSTFFVPLPTELSTSGFQLPSPGLVDFSLETPLCS